MAVAPRHIFEPEHAIGTINTLPSNGRRIHTMEQRQNGNNTRERKREREREYSACVCLCVNEKERERPVRGNNCIAACSVRRKSIEERKHCTSMVV